MTGAIPRGYCRWGVSKGKDDPPRGGVGVGALAWKWWGRETTHCGEVRGVRGGGIKGIYPIRVEAERVEEADLGDDGEHTNT